ncbi:hypothetical protein AB6A40_000341 [Gnathostoma spinigerum]|uniref:Uncharacterized protein n=1 Tax=Gnathostoma spinigerum TaxID=75299 RepID=A0ABD6E400_9BILA
MNSRGSQLVLHHKPTLIPFRLYCFLTSCRLCFDESFLGAWGYAKVELPSSAEFILTAWHSSTEGIKMTSLVLGVTPRSNSRPRLNSSSLLGIPLLKASKW